MSAAHDARPRSTRRLVDALPAIYRESSVLGDLLDPFEAMLLGTGEDGSTGGLEESVARLHELLDPERTPTRFLPWLASWVGIELPAGASEPAQRRLVGAAVATRRMRGTAVGLKRMLELATGGEAHVTEPAAPDLQIGVHSTIGVDSCVEGPDIRWFHVHVTLPDEASRRQHDHDERDESDAAGAGLSERLEELARSIIEGERPIHTRYTLTVSDAAEEESE